MEHLFIAGKASLPPILLLHGTGGDEHSLVDVAQFVAPDAPILSLRGDVSENGANRFFKRFADGSFDLVDLAGKTKELLSETKRLAEKYDLVFNDFVALGYSNGANIAANALLQEEEGFHYGILFHAMPAGNDPDKFDISHRRVFLTAGMNDPIVTQAASTTLERELESRGASVETMWTVSGHQLTMPELEGARDWYQKLSGDKYAI
ncbi:alpha/beta hydrolase [Listeria aquatica]|uniref:alpha/beta hydrolase n=1 Tax=Listeria aquatica TaxID=1494960 RepID=UPI003F6E8CC5